jgi:hypothetical protein
MDKVVGVTIGTKSPHTKNKIYYYSTNEELKRGDNLDIKVPSGGSPNATIVIQDSKKKFSKPIKPLEKV